MRRPSSSWWNHPLAVSIWAVIAAFGTYFCMYAFRKPFTASDYQKLELWGIGYKTILVISQVIGYTISKFLGIKVASEVSNQRRALTLIVLIGIAELSLLLFAITPYPYNFFWLFCNGIPLGMVFSLVIGVLEGRRHTEALAAGLCISFILAGGVTRSTGSYLLEEYKVSLFWMPFLAGLIFAIPFLIFVWMLTRVPSPSRSDVDARSERLPMNSQERRAFYRRYAFGLTVLVLSYLTITVLRSVRDDYSKELWNGLGGADSSSVYAKIETYVSLALLFVFSLAVCIPDNRLAFSYAMFLAVLGSVILVFALIGLEAGIFTPFQFMVCHGIGLYLPYMAVHTTVFERLMAMTRDRGNIGYLMSLSDAFGYLGYIIALLILNILMSKSESQTRFVTVFIPLSWAIAVLSLGLLIPCWYYFLRHPSTRNLQPNHQSEEDSLPGVHN